MAFAGKRTGQIVLAAASGWLLAITGCLPGTLLHGDPSRDIYPTNASDLRPGSYCEIEMNVPLTATKDSSHCYKGTIKEVTREEVVLTDVLEETQIDLGTSGSSRPPSQTKHDLVHVYLTGVKEIWALRPPKGDAAHPAGSATAPPAAAKLPSDGAHPTLPAGDEPARFDAR